MKPEERNFYDELQGFDPEGMEKYLKEQESIGRRIAYLAHRVFEQTEEGKELLSIWTATVLMTPVVEAGLDVQEICVREGYSRFVRAIIRSVKQVEAGEK